jgi:hypothetical protein
VCIFTDTVAGWYRRRHIQRGLPAGETGAVTVIQRANSDQRLNPHLRIVFLDGGYSPDRDGKGHLFHPAPAPTQDEIEPPVAHASKRILRFLQHRGVLSLVAAPGNGEITIIANEPNCSPQPPPSLRPSTAPSATLAFGRRLLLP